MYACWKLETLRTNLIFACLSKNRTILNDHTGIFPNTITLSFIALQVQSHDTAIRKTISAEVIFYVTLYLAHDFQANSKLHVCAGAKARRLACLLILCTLCWFKNVKAGDTHVRQC